MTARFCRGLIYFSLLLGAPAFAANFHLVGWVNTLVPGGGQLLLGNYTYAAFQATAEVGTFMAGYNMSAKSPFTLDGVPEQIPPRLPSTVGQDVPDRDITPSLHADILQEIGIKYHMVNIYDSYRQAGATGGQGIDKSSIAELFASPFRPSIVFDKWVVGPLLIALAYHAYGYSTESIVPAAQLTADSNREYQFVYGGVYPFGSAAPEEMFYRGFLQNEMYALTGTFLLAVPLSSAAYAFSHEQESRLGAGVSGLYLGALTAGEKGQLAKPIAFHFWSDVIMGAHAIASLLRNQNAPANSQAQSFYFSWGWNFH